MSISEVLYPEKVTLYAEGSTVKTDLNVVPTALRLVASEVPCAIHRGSQDALDAATLLGLQSRLVGSAYFQISAETLVRERTIVVDGENIVWIVRDAPAVHKHPLPAFEPTNHIKALLERSNVRPDSLAAS